MAIQVRRGLKKDFDPYKMLPGEWAVSIDNQTQNQIVWMCFAAGVVKRMGTYEDFKQQIEEATQDIRDQYIAEFDEIEEAIKQIADTTQRNADTVIQIKSDIVNTYIPQMQQYVTSAENSANLASSKAAEAEDYSKLSESWAHGNTGVRSGEDTNNSEYFSFLADKLVQEAQKLLEQAQRIVAAATEGALIAMGTIPFASLPSTTNIGAMYNISDDFTTDSRFVEGAGVFYRAGANVYWTKDGKWDVMIGAQVTGVKGDAESTYHIGNVNLTKANIGLGNVDNTADVNKNVKYATTAGSAPASDVYSWAKSASKPSYSSNEISGLGGAATQAVANNLTTTASGSVLDARQGKTLSDKLDTIGTLYKADPIAKTIANNGSATITKNVTLPGKAFYLIIMRCNSSINMILTNNANKDKLAVSANTATGVYYLDLTKESRDFTVYVTGENYTGSTINTSDDVSYFGLIAIRIK